LKLTGQSPIQKMMSLLNLAEIVHKFFWNGSHHQTFNLFTSHPENRSETAWGSGAGARPSKPVELAWVKNVWQMEGGVGRRKNQHGLPTPDWGSDSRRDLPDTVTGPLNQDQVGQKRVGQYGRIFDDTQSVSFTAVQS
jgi:hypothetical protein